MPKKQLWVLLIGAFALPLFAADPFVGEWMIDEEMCEDSRVFWTADGRHGALVSEDGQWVELNSVAYTREGDVITYTAAPPIIGDSADPITERLQITLHDENRITVENLGQSPPDNQVDFVRCPPR